MKVIIEVGLRCPQCDRWQARTAHGITVAQCEASRGRPCQYPFEHHRARRRPFVRITRSRS